MTTPSTDPLEVARGGLWRISADVAVSGGPEQDPLTAHLSPEGRYAVIDLRAPAVAPRVLSGPAAVIWDAVDGTRDTAAIVDHVADGFDLAPDDVRADVEAFLVELAAAGLLTQEDER